MSAIGPIAATEHCYPVFLEGQVLTHNDLNLLRDYVYSKWAFHNGAMFGFGVACGLDGVPTATDITFETGFALAQSGRALELTTAFTIKWGDIQAVQSPAAFGIDFVTTTSRGGLTAVLVPNDTQKPISEECDPQTGCRAHTIEWCEGAQIVFAKGELKADAFLAGPVFKLQPLEPTTKDDVSADDFKKLRDALAELLKAANVEQATIDLLTKIELKTGERGLNLMKVGVVNEVLYTLWEYERCRAIDDGDCQVAAGLPAVALGWLDPATKTWDCHFRHHFRLSKALYRAIRGYRCEDLCGEYIDRIRVLVQNFDPPKLPPVSDPPSKNPPKVDICKLKEYYAGRCHWTKPKKEFPGNFVTVDPTRFVKKKPDPPPPDERFTISSQPWDVAEVHGTYDPVDAGIVHLTDYLGFEGKASKEAIQKDVPGEVHVVPAEEFANIAGLERALVGSASDAIYLGVDSRSDTPELNAVVETGVVATGQTLQQVPTIGATAAEAKTSSAQALQEAVQAVATAGTAALDAKAAKDGLAGVQQSFGTFRTELDGKFDGLRGEWTQFQRGLPNVGKLNQAGQLVDTFGGFQTKLEEVATKVEGIRADVDNHKQLLDNETAKVEALGQGQTTLGQSFAGLRTDLDAQKQTLGQTSATVAKLDDAQAGLARQLETTKGELTTSIQSAHDEVNAQKDIVARVEKAQEASAQDLKTETRTLRDRVDRVVAPPRPITLPTPVPVPNAIVNALDAMRGAVETATPRARTARVRERLAAADPHLEALRAEAELGGNLAAEQPAALAAAADALTDAVAAAGLDRRSREYRRLARAVSDLREALGVPAGGGG